MHFLDKPAHNIVDLLLALFLFGRTFLNAIWTPLKKRLGNHWIIEIFMFTLYFKVLRRQKLWLKA